MKIRKLELKNIGVFDDEIIKFQPCPVKDKAEIHIFTGQNGSGKSTILLTLASGFRNGIGQVLHKRIRYSDTQNAGYIITFDDQETTEYLNIPSQKIRSDYRTTSKEIGDYRRLLAYDELNRADFPKKYLDKGMSFAVFSFSGYRQAKAERVEAIKEPEDFNPLLLSLDFAKEFHQERELTINQLIANNISKSALEKARDKKKAEKFANVVKSIEQIISEITGWTIEFDLQTQPTNLITKINGEELDFDVLPDGLISLISWIAYLLGRVDLLKWQDDLPIFEKNLILLLDEIEVHLHPAWQRKILPVVQKLFKNSQIFVSTHSPFVVNSVDDAWVYELKLENGKARVAEKSLTKTAYSYQTVLREIFDVEERFGEGIENQGTEANLKEFYKQRDAILKKNGKRKVDKKKFLKFAGNLASQSAELQSLVFLELARLSNETGEPYEL